MPCKELRGRYRNARVLQYNVSGYKELKSMDLEAIPGLSDEVNTEIHSMNIEFSSYQNEQGDADDTADGAKVCPR